MKKDKKKFLDGEPAAKHIMKYIEKIPNTPRGDSVLITCPYHSPVYPHFSYHRLSINLTPKYDNEGNYIAVGVFHCWSCGMVGFFNQLIDDPKLSKERRLEAKPIPGSGSSKDTELFKVALKKESINDVFKPLPAFSLGKWKNDWRGISKSLLRKYGAKSYFDYSPDVKSRSGVNLDLGGIYRLLFYAYDSENEKCGWIALASMEDREKGAMKQKNMPGEWASKTVLFHEKFPDDTPLVLVEGPFDALRLIKEGIPAIAMLGAGNFSDEKRNLIASKASHIIILFDGDETGRKDAKIVKDEIQDYVPTLNLKLPILKDKDKQLDPGNMSQKYVDILRKKIKEFVKNN